MLEKIKLKLIKVILKKYVLGYVVDAYKGITGYKTQIFLGLTVLIWFMESIGAIPSELAKQLYELFATGGAFSLLQKLKRFQPIIEDLAKDVKVKEMKS